MIKSILSECMQNKNLSSKVYMLAAVSIFGGYMFQTQAATIDKNQTYLKQVDIYTMQPMQPQSQTQPKPVQKNQDAPANNNVMVKGIPANVYFGSIGNQKIETIETIETTQTTALAIEKKIITKPNDKIAVFLNKTPKNIVEIPDVVNAPNISNATSKQIILDKMVKDIEVANVAKNKPVTANNNNNDDENQNKTKKKQQQSTLNKTQEKIEETTENKEDPDQQNAIQKSFNFVKNSLQKGMASWYGKPFHGRTTANGEKYNMYANTAAHRTLPLGTYVKVTNRHNQKSTVLRINDRGPYAHGRLIDVSFAAAQKLDFIKTGATLVDVQVIKK
jgi:rare lipoprotein A (peptidoglycan hydrolase)